MILDNDSKDLNAFNPDCAVENVARFKNPKRNTKLEHF